MPWRWPSRTCPCRRGGAASAAPRSSRPGGGGRNALPSILRHVAFCGGVGGDGLFHFLLGLAGFLASADLSLGHLISPRLNITGFAPNAAERRRGPARRLHGPSSTGPTPARGLSA